MSELTSNVGEEKVTICVLGSVASYAPLSKRVSAQHSADNNHILELNRRIV